ncbi:MAG: hypothetical protein Q8R78_00175 [Candidatus Omnitrophota bacterium]|nr:hypothetical protein [Candidatus Omnitrophota bacterium]
MRRVAGVGLAAVMALALGVCAGCGTIRWGRVASRVQQISIGDTRDDVVRKLGKPDQVMSKTLTSAGREQVVWLYDAVNRVPRWLRRETEDTGEQIADSVVREGQYQLARVNNPPYLITLVDGKVVSIIRQER